MQTYRMRQCDKAVLLGLESEQKALRGRRKSYEELRAKSRPELQDLIDERLEELRYFDGWLDSFIEHYKDMFKGGDQ